MKAIKKLIYSAILLTIPSLVSAHLIGGSGLGNGAVHPLSGLDHLIAMVAVGIISTRYSGKAMWLIPLTFILSMLIGGMVGMAGVEISFIEIGVALSVLFLGVAVFLRRKFSLWITMAFVAISAILHGHAHGSEIPIMASPVFYAAGFVLITALLHISGVLIGYYAKRANIATQFLRISGAATAIAGLSFLVI